MFTFPDSISRLVFQYPTKKQLSLSTQVLQFLGGNEQRYPITIALRQWQAEPVLLPEETLAQLAAFFTLVSGSNNPFQFTDPWDGTVYPSCYFKENRLESTVKEQNRAAVILTILEGRVQS